MKGKVLFGIIVLLGALLIPTVCSAQYFSEDFSGDAGKWMAADLAWNVQFGGGGDRVMMSYASDQGGVWFFDLRGLGETYHYITDPGGFLGNVLDVRIEL